MTYAPLTGHTDDAYTVEEWYADIAQSEVYVGNKVGTVAVQLPTSGLVTADITFMGRDRSIKGTSAYHTELHFLQAVPVFSHRLRCWWSMVFL